MSKKRWFVLLCLFVLYLLVGAAIFFFIESHEERKRAEIENNEKQELEILLKEYFTGNYTMRRILFAKLTDYCGKPLDINISENPFEYRWDFYHSLFFVITVVSTIGYGNLAPTTMLTRIFMIFYGLIGIPLNGIVIFTLGDFFGNSFKKLHQRWKNTKLEAKLDYQIANLGLIGQVILYLIPGFTFFIFLPSSIMTVFEGWEYDVSVYYSFVSLTTIGFGDYVAGVTDTYGFGILYFIYKIFLLVWIIGGMGYVAMILTFISNGLRSKRMKKIEHMLSENLKNTPKKIRSELRTLLHELLFLRVKPVFKGEFHYVPSSEPLERSQSCPNLTMYKLDEWPTSREKRAMSMCYKLTGTGVDKVPSDSYLNQIDIEKTFRPTPELLHQTDLLMKVVNALTNEDNTHGGVHGFSDKEILSTELIPTKYLKNRRAISDIRPPSSYLSSKSVTPTTTWYGADAERTIKELKKRQRAKSVFEFKRPEKETVFQKIKNRIMLKDEACDDIEKQPLPKDDVMAQIVNREENSIVQQDITKESKILEQTSIADFIRALSAVTTSPTTNICSNQSITDKRRSSLFPEISHQHHKVPRRFSLKPSDENVLNHSTTTTSKLKEKIRKMSVAFQDERRGSLVMEASNSIPPTVDENAVSSSSFRKISTRFSVKPVLPGKTIYPQQLPQRQQQQQFHFQK